MFIEFVGKKKLPDGMFKKNIFILNKNSICYSIIDYDKVGGIKNIYVKLINGDEIFVEEKESAEKLYKFLGD